MLVRCCMMNEEERTFLLTLARRSLQHFLFEKKCLTIDEGAVPSPQFKEKLATFVTLTKNGELRGCMGNLEPVEELCKSVIHNATNAAFEDPRFPPLTEEELDQIKIEISVLSPNKECGLKDVQEGEGIILRSGIRSAVFLPQVWEQLPVKEDFLSHLCLKAGLPIDCWKNEETEFSKFSVEKFGE